MRTLVTALTLLALLIVPAAAFAAPGNGAGGVSGPAFYVDGELYRTVGTPTDLSRTAAPASSFDTIYAIDGQPNVATAAPGDTDYNGGRWMVHSVEISDYDAALAVADANDNGVLDSDDELDAAMAAGLAVDNGAVRSFVCPVIPLNS